MSSELWFRDEEGFVGGGGEAAAVLRPSTVLTRLPLKEAAGPSWEVVCGFGTEREQLDHLITDPGALAL